MIIRVKCLLPLLFFVFSSNTGNAQHAESKKVLLVMIDSVLNVQPYLNVETVSILQNRTIPFTLKLVPTYISSGLIDSSCLYQSLTKHNPIDIDEPANSRHVYLDENSSENTPLKYGKPQDIIHVALSTPVFSQDGENCFIECTYLLEGRSSSASCFILKKNKENNWKISRMVREFSIGCGALINNPDDYFKLTGRRIDTTLHRGWQ